MMEVVQEKGLGKEPAQVQPQDSKYNRYPPAFAKYEDVIADPKLFRETLEKLHSTLGTKFMIPTVGGKELDLHKLFVEVTSRGGIEKVIRERKWKEITTSFNFPSTATNASFVLRKYYFSLLNHYEQIYFFRAEGWKSSLSAPFTPSPDSVLAQRSGDPLLSQDAHSTARKHRRIASESTLLGVNCPVVGVINGKFEHGYLVTVQVGVKIFQGIVYHANEHVAAQGMETVNNTIVGTCRRKRRKKLSKLDPTHPKPNRSGYNFFFAEQHARLKPLHPGKDREISKMIGDLWSKLTEAEKAVYQEIGLKDKERYRSEMVLYRERQKNGGVISNAVPIQQRAAEPNVPVASAEQKTKMVEDNSLSSLETESSPTESDSELEESPEADTGPNSTSVTEELPIETNNFELRMRDQIQIENVSNVKTVPSEEPEVTMEEAYKNEQ